MNPEKTRTNINSLKPRSSRSSYIFLGFLIIVGLGILIWQLLCLNYYDKSNFYFGFLIIFVYHLVLFGLFSATGHFKQKRLINNLLYALSLIVPHLADVLGLEPINKIEFKRKLK
jgi:hypothetical protein